jgi:hypothetical protein
VKLHQFAVDEFIAFAVGQVQEVFGSVSSRGCHCTLDRPQALHGILLVIFGL